MYTSPDGYSPARQVTRDMEIRIINSVIDECIKQGLYLSVNDGEEHFARTNVKATLIDQLMNTDEDRLYLHLTATSKGSIGALYLVYGESGWDVICDYHVSVEKYIPQTLQLVDDLCN